MLTEVLWPALEHNQPKNTTSWRTKEEHYKLPDACQLHPPGSLNLSPAWHEQAKDVCPIICAL